MTNQKETLKEYAQTQKDETHREEEIKAVFCPVCGYYCLGKGGIGCIDKKGFYEMRPKEDDHYPKDKCEEIERDMPECYEWSNK